MVFRTGIAYTARKYDGTLKEKIPFRGYFTMISFLVAVVGFIIIATYFGMARKEVKLGAGSLFIINYGLYLILFLFDTLFIDAFVLGYWRPGFLHLSEERGRESMKEHLRKSLPVGMGFGVLISSLATLVAYFAFMS